MDHLWSPWRFDYVTGKKGPAEACVFCDVARPPDPASLVVHEGATCFVILNLYPYNNGHLLVVPRRHVPSLTDLDLEELHELASGVQHAEAVLREAYAPHGLNVGINLGKPAGAGVEAHLHAHVVPRWNGDTNFMTIIGQTRVLPEELPQTAARLRPLFARTP